MRKKILTLIVISSLFIITGCGNGSFNSTPENVAEEMVKRMSEGDYKEIAELLSYEEDTFIDSDVFVQYLSENKLNIEGNKKNEVVETETTDSQTSKSVEVKIDNNKIIKVNTIKSGDKWYVNLGYDAYDENLVIKVPSNSVVKLNDVVLDSKKYTTVTTETKTTTMGQSYSYDVEKVVYTIPKILSGKYKLTVENSNIETINEEIHSNRRYYRNYLEDDNKNVFGTSYSEYSVITSVNSKTKETIKNQINSYLNDLLKATNEDADFTTLNNHLGQFKQSDLDKLSSEYSDLLKDKTYKNSYKEELCSEFSLSKVDYYDNNGIYYYGDNAIVAMISYDVRYHYIFNYIGFMSSMNDTNHKDEYKTKTYKAVILFRKNENKYEMIGGTIGMIPYV